MKQNLILIVLGAAVILQSIVIVNQREELHKAIIAVNTAQATVNSFAKTCKGYEECARSAIEQRDWALRELRHENKYE